MFFKFIVPDSFDMSGAAVVKLCVDFVNFQMSLV